MGYSLLLSLDGKKNETIECLFQPYHNFFVYVCVFIFSGMVTDGEFNSLRTQGETRPVHLWQIIHDARESVSRQRMVTLEKMLKKIGGL